MTKVFTLFTRSGFLLIVILLMTMLKSSRTASSDGLSMSNDDDDEANLEEERRELDYQKLRRFLLTSNAEQRAAKREKQESYKRELIREYLESISDPDPERFQDVKKRFCASLDEFYATQAACLG